MKLKKYLLKNRKKMNRKYFSFTAIIGASEPDRAKRAIFIYY